MLRVKVSMSKEDSKSLSMTSWLILQITCPEPHRLRRGKPASTFACPQLPILVAAPAIETPFGQDSAHVEPSSGEGSGAWQKEKGTAGDMPLQPKFNDGNRVIISTMEIEWLSSI